MTDELRRLTVEFNAEDWARLEAERDRLIKSTGYTVSYSDIIRGWVREHCKATRKKGAA
jgi:hypothetical protein